MAGVGEREMGRDEMQVAAPEHMDYDKSKQVGQASVARVPRAGARRTRAVASARRGRICGRPPAHRGLFT